MEKQNDSKNTKKNIIIVCLIGLVIILGAMLYNKQNKYEEWVVCDYVGELEDYKETVKFRFMFDQMYGYYEERTMTFEDKDVFNEALEKVNNFGKDFTQSDELKYKVETEGSNINTTFYIKALNYKDFIKNYLNDFDITVESKKEEVINKLGTNYKCKIVS